MNRSIIYFAHTERGFDMNEKNIQQKRKHTHKKILILSSFLFLLLVFCFLKKVVFQKEQREIPKNMDINYSFTEIFQNDITDYDIQDDNIQDNMSQNITTDTSWYLMLVNKWNPIPENYEVNLVKIKGGECVDERIYEPLMEMLEDAKDENWNQLPKVVSGYRTAEKQQSLYDEKITEYKKKGYSESEAKELAEEWVAVPGYSEHQLGFAVDINGATYDLYLWLQENSYKYGFIFRYPGYKTEITGISEEVWHYRYVGVEAATEIYEQGLCLEEYLENIKE